MYLMKILPLIIPCCLLLNCEKPQENSSTDAPAQTLAPTLEVNTPEVSTSKKNMTPSLLDTPENEGEKIDYGAKYTFNRPEDNTKIIFGAYQSVRPASWEWIVPTSISNTCNYRMNGTETSEPALLTIKQFSLEESEPISKAKERWIALFRSDAGGPIFASMDALEVDGSDASVVTLLGEYMGAGSGWRLKDHMLVVIVLRNDTTTTYIKILGPKATVDQHASSLGLFLKNIKWTEPIENTE
jgi:hypothetical protein